MSGRDTTDPSVEDDLDRAVARRLKPDQGLAMLDEWRATACQLRQIERLLEPEDRAGGTGCGQALRAAGERPERVLDRPLADFPRGGAQEDRNLALRMALGALSLLAALAWAACQVLC